MAASAWQSVQSTWTSLKTTVTEAATQVMQTIRNAWDSITSFSIGELIDTLTQVAPFFKSVQAAIQDPSQFTDPIIQGIVDRLSGAPAEAENKASELISANQPAESGARGTPITVMRQVSTEAATPQRDRAGFDEVRTGAWAAIRNQWSQLDLWELVKQALWDLIWPWPGVAEDWNQLNQDLRHKADQIGSAASWDTLPTLISHLADIPLIIWRAVNSILGRLSGWFTIGSVVVGAVIGAFFGGAGAIPGAMAGLAVAGKVGLVIAASTAGELINSAIKVILDLFLVPQTPEEQQEDYNQIGSSAIGLGVMAVIVALAWIAARLIGAIVKATKGRSSATPDSPGNTPVDETPGNTPVDETPGNTPVDETPGNTPPVELPRTWDAFDPQLNDSFIRRLREFRGNDDLHAPRDLRGGEGQVFPSEIHPGLALKRWFDKRIRDLDLSIQKLEQTKAAVDNDPRLSADLEVVKIYERGEDWILRDFDASSNVLKDFLDNPEVAASRQRLIRLLEGTTDPMLRDVLGKLKKNPPSANLHWSEDLGKILIIDMQ
ncbi:MAG TPA: hypothetical protein VFS21_19440 [Roseiflexaceae bacterium]|nr:hypothetical protein [Roseiflexaceae bacterium]